MCLDEDQKHIVIVSSDEVFSSEIEACLLKGGYLIDKKCNDGIDAVMYLSETCPDAVFVDENISFMDSKSIIEKIRARGFENLVFYVSDNISDDKKLTGLISGNIIKPVTEKFLIPWIYAEFRKKKEFDAVLKGKNRLLLEMDKNKMWQEAVGMIASKEKICVGEAEIILLEKIKTSGMEKEEFIKKMLSV